ncbi:MAG: dolichol-phosphate mannosyltransferase [Parcubacteria group bacterium Gr01-1014_33]|nr:MAG: dolichol-phosphate mannosyltransferase [Parcubacteria group bacterium Gr01-1014_33]
MQRNDSHIYVIIPTYNERENITSLVEKIFDLGLPNLEMMIVDDNSPDGTGRIAEALARQYPIQVIHREKKEGLGTAYTTAFKEILARNPEQKPEYIVQMDADFSHDPAMIPALLNASEAHDVVIGSRYTPGGKIENWEYTRRVLSKWGNWYARAILRVPYRDMTSGFKCYRTEVLHTIDLNSLSSVGYNFQIETVYKAHTKGFRIREIPITFTERRAGVSKMNIPIILESFWKVLALRLKE